MYCMPVHSLIVLTHPFLLRTLTAYAVCCVTISHLPQNALAQDQPFPMRLSLHGESSGGWLTLRKTPGWNFPYAVVTNMPGETAASVISRLAAQVDDFSRSGKVLRRSPVLEVKQEALVLRGPEPWIFGGTDTGFSIPDAPYAVSASFDKQSDTASFQWVNPGAGYDSIWIVYYGQLLAVLPGKTTRYIHKRDAIIDSGFSSSDLNVFVVGQKDGTPSNAAGVRLRKHVIQECLMNVPFTQGLAPTFKPWMHNTPAGAVEFLQGALSGMEPATDAWQFEGQGFYQILKGRGAFQGGIWRRFLGLIPGHTYRLRARVNTFQTAEGKWNFTFHAAYNPVSGLDLTSAQLAGIAMLPDKSKGPSAGQIAKYDYAATTGGRWVTCVSQGGEAGKPCRDITLPDTGINSVTVWFRFEGNGIPNGAVGIDSVTIEDLGQCERNPRNAGGKSSEE